MSAVKCAYNLVIENVEEVELVFGQISAHLLPKDNESLPSQLLSVPHSHLNHFPIRTKQMEQCYPHFYLNIIKSLSKKLTFLIDFVI